MCVMALGALSAVMGAFSAISQGIAAKQAADANAKMAHEEAKRIAQLGLIAENAKRRESDQILGQQIVDMTHAGLSPATGTALDVAFQSRKNAEMDALAIRADAQMRTEQRMNQASIFKSEGQNALFGSFMTAGGKLLGGIPSMPSLG